MTLVDKVNIELKEAMKRKDQASLRGLRAIKSAILLVQTSGAGKEINEASEIELLQKLIKQRRDSLVIFEQQNREDLAVKEREEIETISKFLPQQLSAEELKSIIEGIIKKTGASSVKEMGLVIKTAREQLAGKAEGKAIAETVKSLLG